MEIIRKYFPSLSSVQFDRLKRLETLYGEWNAKINVISRKDISQLYLHHVLHSLAIGKYVQFHAGSRILDVGTGGGFPGIPLAILFPDCDFLLIDSVGKKIKVVEAIVQTLELRNCRSQCMRVEQLAEKFDFVVSRAVAPLLKLTGWTIRLIRSEQINKVPNGILALKGGDLKEETNIEFKTYTLNLVDIFEESFFETKKLVHVII
jgi:16S rRNA (guanine527-N7)-methyltransferase